jgi:autotransporter translocation and assembly factor TamB
VVTFTSFEQHDAEAKATPYRQSFLNLSVNIGVSIAPTVEIEIMIGASGQNTGAIQGGGSLSLQYTPTNGPRLSGRYTIESGKLNMNVPLLHVHQMEIRSGSTIQWTGDITNPILDITAEDRIKASVTLDG